jgi:hypothetical protein
MTDNGEGVKVSEMFLRHTMESVNTVAAIYGAANQDVETKNTGD